MNVEKMATTLQEAITEAQKVAVTRQHQEVGIVHLWKIFLQPNYSGRNSYTDVGLDANALEREVDNALNEYPSMAGGNVQYGQNLSQNLFHLLQKVDSLREEFQDEFLSAEIILLALVKLENYRLTRYLMQ